MNILFSPIRADFNFVYSYANDSITATLEGEALTDTFDFSALPNGEIGEITTLLPYNPIVSAERVDGVLSVVLLNPIGTDATEQEQFPEWMVV